MGNFPPDLYYRRLDPIQLPLANKFYKRHRASMRARGDEIVWTAFDREIRAILRLRPIASSPGLADQGYWLLGLYTAPTDRRRGVATGLVTAACQWSAAPVWLFCHPDLLGFYDLVGFKLAETLPESLGSRLARYRQKQDLEALELRPRA